MPNTDRDDELRRHLGEVAFRLGDALRGTASQHDLGWQVSTLLLDTACSTRASSRTGNPPSDCPRPGPPELRIRQDMRIGNILDQEAVWLENHREYWADYGNELLRTTGQRWRAEHLTSYALQQVFETVLGAAPVSRSCDQVDVLDIACGGATLLASAAHILRAGNTSLSGQDINEQIVEIARKNLYFAGYPYHLDAQDVLAGDAFAGRSFDVVVADAPLGMMWRAGQVNDDGRFSYGMPATSDATLLFLQAVLAKIKPFSAGGGLAIIFTGAAPLAAGGAGERAIRRAVTERDILQAVIALPEGLNVASENRLHALVLNTAKAPTWRGKTQLVDLRGMFETSLFGPERRQLNHAALNELAQAMTEPESSAHARVVGSDRFAFQRVDVSLHGAHISTNARRHSPSFTMLAPAGRDVLAWRTHHYGQLGQPPKVDSTSFTEVRWDIDTILPPKPGTEFGRLLNALKWPSSRLVNFVKDIEYLRSVTAPERANRIDELRDATRLILPLEPHFNAAYGLVPEVVPVNRCLLLTLLPEVDTMRCPKDLGQWLKVKFE